MNTWNSQAIHSVNGILATLYTTQNDSRRIVEAVGMNSAMIAFENQALLNWFNILQEAQKHNKVNDIINFACQEYPGNQALLH